MKKMNLFPALAVLLIFGFEIFAQEYPKIIEADRIARLDAPEGKVRMVLDTDTYNEIDDQFAVVYALLSKEKLDVEPSGIICWKYSGSIRRINMPGPRYCGI